MRARATRERWSITKILPVIDRIRHLTGKVCNETSNTPASHYAADWDTEKFNSLKDVNALGREYAQTHNEDLLLELCRSFHPYLMKYLGMICRGHVPRIDEGRIHPESKNSCRYY